MTTISTNRGGRHPSNGPDEDHYLAPFPRVELNDSLLDLALSVQRGNWGNLTKLIQSMYGRIPLKSENFPIPSQPRPPRKISANSTPYQAYSIRAKDLTFPNSPPDRTELSLWQNTIAPRITNILLCMAKRSRPSGLEISAYLHMVLGEFLISGQRSPKVAMEKSFGDFLMEGVPRDNEWNDLVMESRPRFLILGKEQNGVAHHWYVIIVDIDTRRAYCFDSKTEQDTRFKHIKAFTFLKKEWAIRLPRIPVPEQMIELPSFTRNDAHSSGFICLYHIILLFRKPAYLRKLRHGDVIATQKHLDRVVRPAERYVGIQIEEPTKEAAPTPELRLGVDGGNHNGPQKKEASMKLKLHIPPKRHRKRPYEKATAAGLSEETKNALPNLSTACKVDDAEPGIDFAATRMISRLQKRAYHKPSSVAYKIKLYKKGDTYQNILGLRCDRAPLGSQEPIDQYRAGDITTPHRCPDENLGEYSRWPNEWQGWDWYNAKRAADRQVVRAQLQRKRGRDADLLELDMKTLRPRKQRR